MHPPPKPTCKAILLCDGTIVEAVTGKLSLIGVFSGFQPKSFPTRLRQFQAFVQITNCIGRYDIVVEIHDLRMDKVIARAEGVSIDIDDRHQSANVVLPIPSISVDHGGRFDLVVFANDDEIDRQSFQVAEVSSDDDD